MKLSLRFALVPAAAVVGFACANQTDDAASSANDDRVIVEASEATSDEMGITEWGIAIAPDAVIVRGYDSSHAQVVRLDQTNGPGSFRVTLADGTARNALTIETSGDELRLRESSFGGDARARRLVSRMASDLATGEVRGGGGALTTKTLRTQNLVENDGGTTVAPGQSGCLAKQCTTSLTSAGSTAALATTSCGTLTPGTVIPAGDPCRSAVSDATNARGREQDSCGGGGSSSDAVCRAEEWVAVKMPYCGGVNNGPDVLCNGTCRRTGATAKPEWDAYRSDCSGLVSWAWGLPAPGATTGSLPSVSNPTTVDALQPGDALNIPSADGHVMLFAGWTDRDHGKARIIEESDCGKVATERETTLKKVSDNSVSESGRTYQTIRKR